MTLRLVGEVSHLLPPGLLELQLLDGARARLRHRYTGAPLSGSVTVEMDYAMDDPAALPAPTINTWGVLGQPCPTSVEGSDEKDGRIAVSMDETVAWTGLQWDLVSAPSAIQEQLKTYLEDVNLRTVSVFHIIMCMMNGTSVWSCNPLCPVIVINDCRCPGETERCAGTRHAGSSLKDVPLGSRDA